MAEDTTPKQETNTTTSAKDSSLLKFIPREAAERYKMIVLEKNGDTLKIGMVDPNNIESQDALRFILNRHNLQAEIYQISEIDFDRVLKEYDASKVTIGKALKDIEKEKIEEDSKKKVIETEKMDEILETAPIAKILDVIIENAIEGDASDIHIEPEEKEVKIRFRVDGILHSSLFLPKHVGPSIVSRVKILANLKIDEKRKPQDGRFKIKYKGRSIDLRISTLPISEGEKVVMRVLDEEKGNVNLEGLGIIGNSKKILEEEINEPYGMILITGPTGSGKSTTLYTALTMMDKEQRNIVTLEDPVEYRIEGVNQSQIYPEINFTFATGLRSILRQDPDIIMVGEIRDEETAELSIHAALTGHLLLSTLHTNNAVGAIPRLVDMKVEPFLLSSSLRLIMAQRLVRRICEHCKESFKPGKKMEELIREILKRIPDIHKKDLNIDENNIVLYRGKGCEYCSKTGMKGRVAVFETIKNTDKLRKLIEEEDISGDALWEEFYNQQSITMREDGVLKAIVGLTTMEEVERATANTTQDTATVENKEEEQIV